MTALTLHTWFHSLPPWRQVLLAHVILSAGGLASFGAIYVACHMIVAASFMPFLVFATLS